jgi:site-specific DNA recombinase
LRRPFHLGLTNPFSITPAFKNARMSFSSRLSLDPFGDLTHQFVVRPDRRISPNQDQRTSRAFGDILLRLCHRLMSRPSRPKPVAVIGKRPVPPPLQNLHHRLLDESIQHRRDAQAFAPLRPAWDFHPPHRLRLVGPVQQLFPDGWPVLFQVILELR